MRPTDPVGPGEQGYKRSRYEVGRRSRRGETMKTLRKTRFVVWTALAGTLAAAGTPWTLAVVQQGRKTTDPPAMAKGKMGQDLFLAIDHRDTAGVQALLKNGADPNSTNGLEFTPIFIAAASHQPEVVDALLKAGAKPDAESSYGTPLWFAAATANLEGANVLLDLGADVNASRNDGMTVLMAASNAGRPDLVAELIKHKADVNADDRNGSTALMLAARAGNDPVVGILLGAGATPDKADAQGVTPLMAASKSRHTGVVKALLKAGANPNAKDSKGQTPLILASSYGEYPDVVQALLSAGADPKATDNTGRSASAIATVRGFKKCASLLGAPTAASLKAVGTVPSAPQAIKASLGALQKSMISFSDKTACVSCHQEGLGRVALGAAQDRGYQVDSRVTRAQMGRINGMLNALKPLHEGALKSPEVMKQIPLIEMNEVSTGYGWLMAGMAAQHQPATEATGAMAMVLARQQSTAGFWSFSLPRVPMQSSFFTFTALGVRALGAYGPKSSAAEVKGRIAKAKGWLLQAEAKNSEDRASRLLGLQWAGATSAEKSQSIGAIISDQRNDGGWGQYPGSNSDAYATGQALYALHEAGVPINNKAYTLGVKYLLRTQDKDGTWFVNKRAIPANNYFDASFPHGQSQYASFNGTCWATMALLQTVKK